MSTAHHAFGVVGEEMPYHRCCGDHQWPPAEVCLDVNRFDVRFTSYGDDHFNSAFLEVFGTKEEAVVERWKQVNLEVCALLLRLHPHSQCGRMVPQDWIGRSGEEDAG